MQIIWKQEHQHPVVGGSLFNSTADVASQQRKFLPPTSSSRRWRNPGADNNRGSRGKAAWETTERRLVSSSMDQYGQARRVVGCTKIPCVQVSHVPRGGLPQPDRFVTAM